MGCHQTTDSGSSKPTSDGTSSGSESGGSSSTSDSSSATTEKSVAYCRYYFNGITPSDASKTVTVASGYELTISDTYTSIPLDVIKAGQPNMAFVASHHYTYNGATNAILG